MEIKLINDQDRLIFDPKTLDTIFKIAEFADDDIFLVGTVFYFDNQAYCNLVEVMEQKIRYQNVEVDVDAFKETVEAIEENGGGMAMNLIIQCKGKKGVSIYSGDETKLKELIEAYGEGYLMVVNKDNETKINYYNYNCGFKIEDIGYDIDVSGECDLTDDEIRKMIDEKVTSTTSTYYQNTTSTVDTTKKEEPYNPSELMKKKPALTSLT